MPYEARGGIASVTLNRPNKMHTLSEAAVQGVADRSPRGSAGLTASRKLASPISADSPLSISAMKEQLRILTGSHPMSPQGFERVQGLRRVVYDSQDYLEGVRAFADFGTPI